MLTDTSLSALSLDGSSSNRLLDSFLNKEVVIEKLAKDQPGDQPLLPLAEVLEAQSLTTIVLPLTNRDKAGSGLLCLLYSEQNQSLESALSPEHIGFAPGIIWFRRGVDGKSAVTENAKEPAAVFYRVDRQRHRRQISLYRRALPTRTRTHQDARRRCL